MNDLSKAQKQLSRKQKKSNNQNKQRLLVAKLHDKVAKKRNEYHHHISNLLLSDNQVTTIAFEDLNIKGRIKNRKLSRHIADVVWSRFVDVVEYKAQWLGKNVIYCGRYQPSSKQRGCGYHHKALQLKDRYGFAQVVMLAMIGIYSQRTISRSLHLLMR